MSLGSGLGLQATNTLWDKIYCLLFLRFVLVWQLIDSRQVRGKGKKNLSQLILTQSWFCESGTWWIRWGYLQEEKQLCFPCNCLFVLQTFTEYLLCARYYTRGNNKKGTYCPIIKNLLQSSGCRNVKSLANERQTSSSLYSTILGFYWKVTFTV